MPKSGSKKLPLSLKTSNGKQQKISNFFIASKTVNVNNDERKEDTIDPVENQQRPIGSRPLGENLCIQCLKKSPVSSSSVCSQCNIIENTPGTERNDTFLQAKKSPLIESTDNRVSNNPKVDILNSPDIVLATPPIKSKKSFQAKPFKRKCSFENEFNSKRKHAPDQAEQQHINLTNNSNSNTSTVKHVSCSGNILSGLEENSITSQKSRNPFRSPCLDGNVNKSNGILKVTKSHKDNDVTAPISVENVSVYFPSEPDYPHNCKEEALDQDLNKPKYYDQDIDKDEDHANHAMITKSKNKTNNVRESVLHIKADASVVLPYGSTSVSNDSMENNQYQSQNKDIIYDNAIEQFFDDSDFLEQAFAEPLRLDKLTRCKVTSVEHLKSCGEVVLALTSCNTQVAGSVTCVLRGAWVSSVVSEGDIVSVAARPVEGQEGCWVVDSDGGLLVIHPDTLVSGTTVVGSLFCMRRSVLSDMYRGIDSDSSIMIIGSFLHQLLQEVLKRKVCTVEGIMKVLDEFSKSRYFIFNLYSSNMPFDKTMEKLQEFVPKIHSFVQKYLSTERSNSATRVWNEENSWEGSINDIADIEENIWSPSLGLKGKIDVTVKASARNHKERVMPLELKTGKASFSAEHQGQVILYTMMMSELGKNVDSGLLLYLREGVMKEVAVGAGERRDLMLLRNELVTQLKASHRVVVGSDSQIAAPTLPSPIHHHSACGKCPYLTLCSAALRVGGCDKVSESNPLRQLSESSTSHLQMSHIVYTFHWTGLLRLEHTEAILNSPSLHHIWTLSPADRAKRGSCIPEVKLVDPVVEVIVGSYQHIFQYNTGGVGSLVEGDYVIVSSASRPAVAAGPLTHISQSQFTLLLERDLSVHQETRNVWYVDKYESQSGLVFNMTNLGCLLDSTEQAERLRKAVIDKEIPEFRSKLSSRVLKASVDLVSELNEQQKRAIFRALAADHYILIKGMPGTGKTATIIALVQLAVRLGRSVLITSHTHSAVDNVLLRLRGKVDFLRLGSSHKLHSELVQYGEAGHNFTSPDQLYTFYNSKNVVGVTCLGSSHAVLSRRKFDLCIVDEATQVLQPTVLRPLFSAHKFILIGDPNQLPPLVRSSKAKELGLGESLFARLDRPAVTTELSLQYRMNQTITDLANCLTYGGKLQCGSEEVASATLSVPCSALDGEPVWVRAALSPALEDAVVALDTGSVSEATPCVNTREADIVLHLLATVTKGLSEERVGVIAPYRAQVDYLRHRIKALEWQVEVNTVDQYQGRDKDIIIYSCTRSAKPTESDILGDKNRLTVAITRARHKLIVVGNITLLKGYTFFNQLLNTLPSNCVIPTS